MTEERKDSGHAERGERPNPAGTASGVAEDMGTISDEKIKPGTAIGGHEPGKRPNEEREEIDDERRG